MLPGSSSASGQRPKAMPSEAARRAAASVPRASAESGAGARTEDGACAETGALPGAAAAVAPPAGAAARAVSSRVPAAAGTAAVLIEASLRSTSAAGAGQQTAKGMFSIDDQPKQAPRAHVAPP